MKYVTLTVYLIIKGLLSAGLVGFGFYVWYTAPDRPWLIACSIILGLLAGIGGNDE